MADLHVLFLCKRHYMGKDVLEDRFGRLFHFPCQLAARGVRVTCVMGDYHLKQGCLGPLDRHSVTWFSAPLNRPFKWLRLCSEAAREADVILASSDSIHVCLGDWLSGRWNKPYVVDLYDNYESFGLTGIPGVRKRYRRAVTAAGGVSCVSRALSEKVSVSYKPRGKVTTLNSTIEEGQFLPMDRTEARRELGLPTQGKLVGVCGGLSPERGIANIYRAARELWAHGSDFELVLAGAIHKKAPPPESDRCRVLGNLPVDAMNVFYNAMDLNVLQYLDNDFGRYAYPQKLEEIVATGAPLIAASVGELKCRFSGAPSLLYDPDDIDAIKQAIEAQLLAPDAYETATQNWAGVVADLEDLLRHAVINPGQSAAGEQ
jgi:glycosyltransferase involved in cell wall biosynthesis